MCVFEGSDGRFSHAGFRIHDNIYSRMRLYFAQKRHSPSSTASPIVPKRQDMMMKEEKNTQE